tara:strand:+ start:97 stop:756 length:660 start_codon:yes stop_codon:yes gene_type:complete
MNQTDYLALGMGGPTLLMHDGDACAQIRGFAVQALEDCVFSEFSLNTFPFVTYDGQPDYIESSTHGSDLVTLTAHQFKTGDKVVVSTNGKASLPNGLSDDQIYYIIKASDDTVKFALSYANAIAGTVVATSSDGSSITNATIQKVTDENLATHRSNTKQATFTISGGSALEITKHVDGNTDMFDTDGAEDVKLPKGMTVYLPVWAITLTTGACIVYTRK